MPQPTTADPPPPFVGPRITLAVRTQQSTEDMPSEIVGTDHGRAVVFFVVQVDMAVENGDGVNSLGSVPDDAIISKDYATPPKSAGSQSTQSQITTKATDVDERGVEHALSFYRSSDMDSPSSYHIAPDSIFPPHVR